MKYMLLLVSVVLFGSCSLFKTKCTAISLETNNSEMVQAMGTHSMYVFHIPFGDLAGASLHMNSQESGEKDVFITNPAKTYLAEAVEKEKWVLKEKKEEEKQQVKMTASIALKVDGKNYCFDLLYEGAMMKMQSPPVPHQE